jgi:hypothetical protein
LDLKTAILSGLHISIVFTWKVLKKFWKKLKKKIKKTMETKTKKRLEPFAPSVETDYSDPYNQGIIHINGISKRTWIATMAMQSLVCDPYNNLESLSKDAFRIADAMLEQEEK